MSQYEYLRLDMALDCAQPGDMVWIARDGSATIERYHERIIREWDNEENNEI